MAVSRTTYGAQINCLASFIFYRSFAGSIRALDQAEPVVILTDGAR